MTTKLKYVGTSTIREVTPAHLEASGLLDHEDLTIMVDTRLGNRARVVDVSDATAELLLESEPADWIRLTDEEIAVVQESDEVKAQKEAALAERAEAEKREIEDNFKRAEEERDAQDILGDDLEVPDENL